MIGEIYGIVKSHDETLRNIEEQTKKTNGRVTSLEGTAQMLARVTSENSGIMKDIQNRIEKDINDLAVTNRIVNELERERQGEIKSKTILSDRFKNIFWRIVELMTIGLTVAVVLWVIAMARSAEFWDFFSKLIS